jgi:hypothetical protein
MHLQILILSSQKNNFVRKSQIRKLSHLRNVRKPMEKIKSENLRICGLRNLGADRPPLGFTRFSTAVGGLY